MKILYYRDGDHLVPGIATEKGVAPVTSLPRSVSGPFLSNPFAIDSVASLAAYLVQADDIAFVNEEELAIGPCVPSPQKIICIGLNYKKHAEESGMTAPVVPVVFSKYSNTLIDHGHEVRLGNVGKEFDYEVELGVVIGRECKYVAEADAARYVLGYCTANDMSCRDLQFLSSQWLLGKSLDNFLPLGKYLVTADEVGDPQKLQLKCWLNGELRQSSNTADMIFPVYRLVSFLSQYMTLMPGDIILTGTPEGVIMGMKEKNWLKKGDVVRVEIEKLGFTENKMT